MKDKGALHMSDGCDVSLHSSEHLFFPPSSSSSSSSWSDLSALRERTVSWHIVQSKCARLHVMAFISWRRGVHPGAEVTHYLLLLNLYHVCVCVCLCLQASNTVEVNIETAEKLQVCRLDFMASLNNDIKPVSFFTRLSSSCFCVCVKYVLIWHSQLL